jgi:hypothetical protein
MRVQDPVVVAEHESAATLHFLPIPHLDLGLASPLGHLGPQVHCSVDGLIVELLGWDLQLS